MGGRLGRVWGRWPEPLPILHREARVGQDVVLVQVRLPKALVRRLDHLRIETEQTRQALLEALIEEALNMRQSQD